MMIRRTKRGIRKAEAGSSLIEVLIAGIVFLVGVLAVAPLILQAIGSNGRSKLDTTSTMLAQSVIEQIEAQLAGGGPGSIADCTGPGSTHDIYYGANGATGARLVADGSQIDFSESSPPDGYHMDFTVCPGITAGSTNTPLIYDVRWHSQQLSNTGTYMITVSAKPRNLGSKRFAFALPVTLRTYVGK